jgi:hypothetical protein
MICSKCGSHRVEWKGPLLNLTHTECGECGGIYYGHEIGERKPVPT